MYLHLILKDLELFQKHYTSRMTHNFPSFRTATLRYKLLDDSYLDGGSK